MFIVKKKKYTTRAYDEKQHTLHPESIISVQSSVTVYTVHILNNML